MPNIKQLPVPASKEYGQMLMDEIDKRGRNRVAKLAGIDPTTVWRNVKQGKLTWGTAMKLADAIRKTYAEDGLPMPTIPPPFVAITGVDHYRMCELGERMAKYDGLVDKVVEFALGELHQAERDELLGKAKRLVAHPIRKADDEDDRGD